MNYLDIDKICKLDIRQLLKDAKNEQIPYLQWPKWLNSKISRVYMETISQARKTSKKVHKGVVDNVRVKKEVVSHHYFAAFSMNPDYFYNNKQ